MDFYNITTYIINHQVGLHFTPIKIAPEHTEHQNRVNSTCVAWRVFITAKQFITKPRNWVTGLWRLAVQGFTGRRFLREPRNTLNWHVPLGGYEQPARWFLEKFQKCRFQCNFNKNHTYTFYIHTITHKNSDRT